jgi:uncharacterized protein YdaU (DUF1376 family)
MNYYKRHIGDYLKDTAHLTLIEHGVYARLLDVYYTREGGIPYDQVARLVGARFPEEEAALNSVLHEFFELDDGGLWRQTRCDREIEAMRSKADASRSNGRRGGRPRKTDEEPTRFPVGIPDETKAEPAHNLSHEPITNSHKPLLANSQQTLTEDEERTPPPPSSVVAPNARAVAICVLLRSHRVISFNPSNPHVLRWADDPRVTDDVLLLALQMARDAHAVRPGPSYFAPIIEQLINPPAPKPKADDWHKTERGVDRKGRELGLTPNRGETYDAYKARIWDEIARLKRDGGAHE